MRAIRIIHDEHRSLAAVLHGMRYLVREIRDRAAEPNFDLFRAIAARPFAGGDDADRATGSPNTGRAPKRSARWSRR